MLCERLTGPCRFYLDIDDKDSLTLSLKDVEHIVKIIAARLNRTEESFLIFSNETHHKHRTKPCVSFHVHSTDFHVAHNTLILPFIKMIKREYKDVPFMNCLDIAPYTINQDFRMAYSAKNGMDNYKLPCRKAEREWLFLQRVQGTILVTLPIDTTIDNIPQVTHKIKHSP